MTRSDDESLPRVDVILDPQCESLCEKNTQLLEQQDWQTHPLGVFKRALSSSQDRTPARQSRKIQKFYRDQDKFIRELEHIHSRLHNVSDRDVEMSSVMNGKKWRRRNQWITGTVFLGNLLLAIMKVVASVWSGSLSVISSVLDSFIDLVSSSILWIAARESSKFLPYSYPEGRNRIESVALLVLSVIMASGSFQVIINGFERIVEMAQDKKDGPNVSNGVIILMALCVLVKIVFLVLCKFLGRGPSIEALLVDQRNDCLSITASIVFSVLSSRVPPDYNPGGWLKFLDPVGANLIACYIIYSWIRLARDHTENLVGKSADSKYLQKLAFVCLNHDRRILRLDTIRAFHIGTPFLVEVDIVLNEDMQLHEAHDIGESLQNKLEKLPDVERAFVHLDYESEHHPSSEHKQT